MLGSADDLLVVVGLVHEQRQLRAEVRTDQRRANPAVLDALATEVVWLLDVVVLVVLVPRPEADRGVRSRSFTFADQRHAFTGVYRMLWTDDLYLQGAYCGWW